MEQHSADSCAGSEGATKHGVALPSDQGHYSIRSRATVALLRKTKTKVTFRGQFAPGLCPSATMRLQLHAGPPAPRFRPRQKL